MSTMTTAEVAAAAAGRGAGEPATAGAEGVHDLEPDGRGRSAPHRHGPDHSTAADRVGAGGRQCLLYPGRTHLFAGPTESCKTWAALEVMAQELHAGNAVLYVDIEDEAISAIERLRELGMTADVLTKGSCIATRPRASTGSSSTSYASASSGSSTSTAVRRPWPSSTASPKAAPESLDPDRGTSRSVLQAGTGMAGVGRAGRRDDRPRTEGDEAGSARTAIGSERKRSGLTGASYSFSKVEEFGRGRTGIVEVTIDKDRPGFVGCTAAPTARWSGLWSSCPTSRTTWSTSRSTTRTDIGRKAAQAEADEERLRIAIWYKAEQQPGLTATKLLEGIEGGNDDKNRVLQQLRAEGHLRVEPGPHNAKRHYTAEPLPDDEEED